MKKENVNKKNLENAQGGREYYMRIRDEDRRAAGNSISITAKNKLL